MTRVRRRIGTKKKLPAAGRGRLHQRLAVNFALEYRQAVIMRTDATAKDRIAVVEQVMRSDGRHHIVARRGDKLGGRAGRDVFKNDAQPGAAPQQGLHHRIDEDALPVENVDRRIGHLAMHQQRHATPLHFRQRRITLGEIGNTGIGIGGRPGRIELDRLDETAVRRPPDFVGRRVVRQIERHQWLEVAAGRQRRENTLAVLSRCRNGGHRRPQVGHDDGAGKLSRRMGRNRLERLTVAQVQVPVVRTNQRNTSSRHSAFSEFNWRQF